MLFALAHIALQGEAYAGDVCTAWSTPAEADAIVVEDIPAVESSGLVQSSTDPDRYYTHNDDHTNDATLYVFDVSDGSYLGPQDIRNAENVDWEDLAAGPCPDAITADRCLWIGDIGDNNEVRDTQTLYVVPETLDASVDAIACVIQYPEGKKRDSEALFVDPEGGVRIVSKESGTSHVYRLASPRCDGSVETLTEEAKITLDEPVTGAAMSADGTQVVLRSLSKAWLWSGCELDWSATPTTIDLGAQPQGEAITFAADNSLVTTSEGDPLRAWILPCEATEAAPTCPSCGCGGGKDALLFLIPLSLGVRRRHRRRSRAAQMFR